MSDMLKSAQQAIQTWAGSPTKYHTPWDAIAVLEHVIEAQAKRIAELEHMLRRYITHVRLSEGIDFLSTPADRDYHNLFTPEEFAQLKRIADNSDEQN